MSAGEPSFLLWLREVVQPQADPRSGNAAALDDFSPDGMREYCYPKEFTVSGDALYVVGFNRPHKGAVSLHPLRNLVFRPAFGSGQRIATGSPTKAKIRRGLRKIYDYYYGGNSNENDPAHFSV